MSLNITDISINNFDNLCRTCSQSNDLVSIYKNIYLLEMLATSAQLQLQANDELPKNICRRCVKELNETYTFISKCKAVDAAFRQCLTREKLLNLTENEGEVEMTEIFIKPEISDNESVSDECSSSKDLLKHLDDACEFESKPKQIQQQTHNHHCADCNESFATNAQLKSHYNVCQFRDLLEPGNEHQAEGDCDFEFHDVSAMEDKSQIDDEEEEVAELSERAARNQDFNTLPRRSQKIYEESYRRFIEFCKAKKMEVEFTEAALFAYFSDLAKRMKSSTLWARYSMLKSTLKVKHQVDVSKYLKLRAYLKDQANGYRPKKTRILEEDQIRRFLLEAPDSTHLTTKVALIVGVAGACRCEELLHLKVDDFRDIGSELVLMIPATPTKRPRTVVISDCLQLDIFRRYASQRPPGLTSPRFFFKYSKGRPSKQLIGVHKFGSMPQEIAAYLKLPNSKEYTGHCFRSTGTARREHCH